MPNQTSAHTARLAALERQHAAQQTETAALRREVGTLRRRLARRQRTGRARAVALGLALVALLALSPLGALAANFIDLNNGSPHNANINAIADAGISKGCVPDGSRYCPNDLVTREQMASFLARTAGLGGNPPVTNALTAVNAQTAANATNAVTAQTALNAPNAQPKYARIIVIPATGTPAENGTALRATLAGITTASATTPFLLALEPGTYDLGGANSLALKPFVDLAGSGRGNTTITHENGVFFNLTDNVEVRDLTVGCVVGAAASECRAVTLAGGTARLTRVGVRVTATATSIATKGIDLVGGTLVIEGGGIVVEGGSATAHGINYQTATGTSQLTIRDSEITVTGTGTRIGLIIGGAGTKTSIIEQSRIAAQTNTISTTGATQTTRVVASQLSGGPIFQSIGILTCAYVYDETYLSVAGCP